LLPQFEQGENLTIETGLQFDFDMSIIRDVAISRCWTKQAKR